MGSRSVDRSSGPAVRRLVGSSLLGLVVIGVVAVAALASSRIVLAAVVPPAVGSAVAAFFARCRRRFGAVLGVLLGLTVAVGSVAFFVTWLETQPTTTGGAGLGIAALFLAVIVVGLLAIIFGGLGGLLGAVLRRELERSARTNAADERDDSADSERAGDRIPTATTDGVHSSNDRSTRSRSGRNASDRDAESVADRYSIAPVLIGSALSTAIFFVPGSPFVGGVATGYLERSGWRRGALLGAASGVIATSLTLIVIVLITVAVLFVFAGAFVDYLPWTAALLTAYFVILSAVGGAVGALVSPSGPTG
ncbi:DUF5518 domain-containing protein [Natrinema caseinilyticum]|uniref:DUF5518 domain-containing protein n=1 Tax=Natrinema caseinilyticum TaxID=2961570 RepID=UPI0020C4DC7E|nr:DUF5518 domain-containing protein [Natrinema caseinilyticum]